MSSNQQKGFWQHFFDSLTIPWVDKTIAVLAVMPFVYILFRIMMRGEMNLPRASIAIQLLIIIITMVIRTTPIRITPNPWYWLLAFVVTYFGFFIAAFAQKGTALIPGVIPNFLSILALAVAVYARLSLGRNIGLVPAQRNIITRGAYGFVRHPIYTGLILSYVGFSLRMFSPRNVTMALLGVGLIVLKSFIEEGFLREAPEYADYMDRVRWRWFPGLA
ncbi:MAG: methyltransferase [Thermodesulfobacteriota bacterium]